MFGALVGLTTETTRAVFSSGGRGSTPVWSVLVGLAGATAAVVGTSGLLWAPPLFGDLWPGLLSAMVVGVALFSLQSGLNGAASGSSAWGIYSLSLGSEAVMRLVLCAVAAAAGAHLLGLAWGVVLACATWVALVVASHDVRQLVHVRVTGSRAALVRRILVACSASGASALILVGYPVLVAVLTNSGAATVALDRHGVYLAGWLVATAVSALVLLAPGSLDSRVLSSLVAGPLAGIAVHAGWGLLRRT